MGRGCFRNAQNSIENDWDGFTGSTSHPSSIKIWKDVGKNISKLSPSAVKLILAILLNKTWCKKKYIMSRFCGLCPSSQKGPLNRDGPRDSTFLEYLPG